MVIPRASGFVSLSVILRTGLFLAAAAAAFAQTLSPAAEALLDRARAADPGRYRFAIDNGAKILPTGDGRSFYVSWMPPARADGAAPPVIVTMHGSESYAFVEIFLWHAGAAKRGYGIIAVQWWFGGDEYYRPEDLHRELRAAVAAAGGVPGRNLLHGFSRGSANTYGVVALDRSSGDRNYPMIIANAGSAGEDYPPNTAIASGAYGYNVFSGTYWIQFCGGRDPNPGSVCPVVRRTTGFIQNFGGVVDTFIEDPEAGHGGFHQTPAYVDSAFDLFQRILDMPPPPDPAKPWTIRRDPQFVISNASTSNVGRVGGEVWLTASAGGGMRVYKSIDGSNASTFEPLSGLREAASALGWAPGEVVPRETADGLPVFYVLGLAPPGANRASLLRMVWFNGSLVPSPEKPVFEGGPADGRFIGVPDITPAADGGLRLTYVARGSTRNNSRTAISVDDGMSFTAEFENPFGDLAVPNPRANDTNVDPAALKLASGGYLGVGMRAARLYLFVSLDGRTFVPVSQPAIEPGDLSPGAAGLFDPTLVQLPDGRIYLYATAGSDPGGASSRIVRAELIPPV